MNKAKILPMNEPIITSYPIHANILSCVSQYQDSILWFYNNYIQLLGGKDLSKSCYIDFCAPIPWRSCPWIYSQRISGEILRKKWREIKEFIIDCIDLDYYVFLYLDQFYIAEAPVYQKQHWIHDSFIYGYDLRNKNFNVADFYQYGKYCYTKAPFSQIEAAYQNLGPITFPDILQGIVFLKPVPYHDYKFDIRRMGEFLQDYLGSKDISKSYTDGYRLDIGDNNDLWCFGMDVYKLLQEYLDIYRREPMMLDIRAFHVVLDHKVLMLSRIKYLIENKYLSPTGSIYEDYQRVVEQAWILRSVALKVCFDKRERMIQKTLDYIQKITTDERVILEQLLDGLVT